MKVYGGRPRPHVVVTGDWTDDEVRAFTDDFPWATEDCRESADRIHPQNCDLIIARGQCTVRDIKLLDRHLIMFGSRCMFGSRGQMYGPLVPRSAGATREWRAPSIDPRLHALRAIDLDGVTDARLLSGVGLGVQLFQGEDETFRLGALAETLEDPPRVLGSAFIRKSTGTGVALIPWPTTRHREWVRALVAVWSETDRDSFANIPQWKQSEGWMTQHELRWLARLTAIEREREGALADLDRRAAEARVELLRAGQEGDRTLRALLTATDDELVRVVAQQFAELGFEVTDMDAVTPDGARREDLRITRPDRPGWAGLVEVKGYRRATLKTADLSKFEKHKLRFRREFHRDPDACILVVNGEADLPPGSRHGPLHADSETVEAQAELGNLIVDTRELFRALASDAPRATIAARLAGLKGLFTWSVD